MRSAGNFHPDWGYLAPAPSFMRTARVVLVATAIGATAGAAVMISLVQHPATDAADAPIAAHALVTSVPLVAEAPVPGPMDEPMVAQAPAAATSAPQMQAATPPASVAVGKPGPIATPPGPGPGSVTALAGPSTPASAAPAEAEARPAATPNETVAEPDPASKQTKNHRTAGYDPTHPAHPAGKKWKPRPFDPLFRLFSSTGRTRDSF
jgi:hypothetical protein